mmetsp:Transcript_26238/g.47287  ORF Transcript_26238/g.47287 Transcript_26238/m.47287 type:complete len:80 (-) Transcript_26238:1538-1777(-)
MTLQMDKCSTCLFDMERHKLGLHYLCRFHRKRTQAWRKECMHSIADDQDILNCLDWDKEQNIYLKHFRSSTHNNKIQLE